MGKGLRTAPRDALIASSTDEQMWGRAFGFQRSLDHGGALSDRFGRLQIVSIGCTARVMMLIAFAWLPDSG